MANQNNTNTNKGGININKTEAKKNTVELLRAISKNGTKLTMININGQTVGCAGYTSEADRKAMEKAIQEAVDGSETTREAIDKLTQIAKLSDAGLVANDTLEQIKVGTTDVIIDYAARNARALCGKVVADLKDLGDVELPNNPLDESAGTRKIPFGGEIWIDRADFMEVPCLSRFLLILFPVKKSGGRKQQWKNSQSQDA